MRMKRIFSIILLFGLIVLLLTGCEAKEEAALEKPVIWTNNNIAGVENKPLSPTFIVLEQDCVAAAITNYHYFNGGVKPGTIELIGEDGKKYGPWQTVGRVGQGDVKDAYWDAFPNIELKKGKYQVVDSDPDTWSHNSQSDNCGFTEGRGSLKDK